MVLYNSFVFITIIYSLLSILTKNKYKLFESVCFFVLGISMVMFSGLRYGIGYDFYNYEGWFERINNAVSYNEINDIELGYVFINKISGSFEQVIFLMAIIGVGIKILYINKYSKNKLISLFMYFTGVYIMFDMGVIRQGVSIAIALISIKYVKDRIFTKFIFTIFIASLFHVSILIFLPIYFLGYKLLNRKIIYGFAILAVSSSFLGLDKHILITLFDMNIPIISSKLNYYIFQYTEDTNLFISILKRVVFLFIFTEVYKKNHNNIDKEDIIFFNCYFLSIIIMGLFSSLPILSSRGTMGLYFMQVFVFATTLNLLNSLVKKIVFFILITILSINTMMSPINHGNSSGQPYSPYNSIFSEYF